MMLCLTCDWELLHTAQADILQRPHSQQAKRYGAKHLQAPQCHHVPHPGNDCQAIQGDYRSRRREDFGENAGGHRADNTQTGRQLQTDPPLSPFSSYSVPATTGCE
eukprot:scaffold286451_cov27-Prasinocladus_malaysianus.AAC.1